MVVRVLFFAYNYKLIKINSISDFIKYAYYGLAFDTTAILYANALFIIFSVLPLVINTKKGYQRFLFYLYFITNFIAFSTNFIDFIYYKYSFNRSTRASLDTVSNESNKTNLFLGFIVNYWHVFALFFLCAIVWVYLYKKVKIHENLPKISVPYFLL